MKKIILSLTLPLFFLLTQCSSNSHSGPNRSNTLPTLINPARTKAWGTPIIAKNSDGYIASYVNPSNTKEQFRIFGSSKLMPFLLYPPNIKGDRMINGVVSKDSQAQIWTKLPLLSNTVKLYQATFANSNKAAEFRSLGITLKDPSGNSGQYRIEAEGTKNQVRTWLSELRFSQ